MRTRGPIGVVLSGGGARGAYEVGVVRGIVEVLGLGPDDPAPFQVFTGTSVGAINATFLASRAHRGDLDIDALAQLWTSLDLAVHARVTLRPWHRHALMDAEPIGALLRDHVDWDALHANVDAGRARALVVPALHVGSGRTAMFAELAPGVDFVPSRDPRRAGIRTRITADHVLASAAIPGVFPPVRIGPSLFYDGGLRFNTPIAPAIRTGAERLVVVSPLHLDPTPVSPHTTLEALGTDLAGDGAPDVSFLLGKMLNALMLDPVAYDLQVLERFNALVALVHETMDAATLARFDETTAHRRGQAYRRIETLSFSPRADIGEEGTAFLAEHTDVVRRSGWAGWFIARVLAGGPSGSDLASYLLFDGRWTSTLIDLGHDDALARSTEIRAFFAADQGASQT